MKTRAEHRMWMADNTAPVRDARNHSEAAREGLDLLRDIAVSLRVIAESLHEHRTFNVDARMGDTQADYGVPR